MRSCYCYPLYCVELGRQALITIGEIVYCLLIVRSSNAVLILERKWRKKYG